MKAAELRELLHNWRKSVGRQMPTANPSYRPAKTQKEPDQRNDQATAAPRRRGLEN